MGNSVIYRANVNLNNEPRTEAAYKALLPRYMALNTAELIAINADITTVVSTMSAAAPRLAELREQIRKLGVVDATLVDELGTCADGLDYAEGLYRGTLQSSDDLGELARECGQTREVFAVDLRNAAAQGVIPAGYLDPYTGAPGFKNMIDDVRMLTQVYRKNWTAMTGKTCRTLEELDRAEAVVHRMGHLVGEKELGATGMTDVAEMRARAFTYAVKRYDEACRVSHFLRWNEGDAESITPSLWTHRGGKRRQDKEPEQPAVQPQNPQQPVIGANGPFVTTPATPATPHIPGMPGGSPFMQ